MAVRPLSNEEIERGLEDLPGWSLRDDRLVRGDSFPGHLAAARLVAEVAEAQEELGHHSDLTLGYNKVGVSVNTHSVGGKVTELDLRLAHRIEDIARGQGVS